MGTCFARDSRVWVARANGPASFLTKDSAEPQRAQSLPLSSVRRDDRVLSADEHGALLFDAVTYLSHAKDDRNEYDMRTIAFESDAKGAEARGAIQITPDHFMYVRCNSGEECADVMSQPPSPLAYRCASYVPARSVSVGSWVAVVSAGRAGMEWAKVAAVESKRVTGAQNIYTKSG